MPSAPFAQWIGRSQSVVHVCFIPLNLDLKVRDGSGVPVHTQGKLPYLINPGRTMGVEGQAAICARVRRMAGLDERSRSFGQS
jgi:hypothetical protein